MNRMSGILLFIIVSMQLVVSQTGFAAEPVVERVEVRGNRRVETDAIRMVIKSQPGDEISYELVAQDIKAIFALGYFNDVRAILIEKPASNRLVYALKEKPSVGKISYEGFEELDEDKIKEVVDIQPLSVLNVARIKANVQKIKELYVEKGFYLAEITHKLTPRSQNRVDLTFVIKERAKVEVKQIILVGNEKIADEELKTV